jgi:crotonobetainyl-CoA:carnitine CoA-transferase CaiB-like acyl-CoA transferase
MLRLNPRIITCSITGTGTTRCTPIDPATTDWWRRAPGCCTTRRVVGAPPWSTSAAARGRFPSSTRRKGLVRGTDRKGPVFPRTSWPSIGATYVATLGIAAALRAREVTGEGQRVTTSLLQGALAAVSLNWQRVEFPDAPLYWMWPIDSRSIEGLYECADGRWVHHWTVRPRWVFAAAEGDELGEVALDTSYRDDPDRLSMEGDGLLSGIFLHPLLTEAFKKFPSAAGRRPRNRPGSE